MSEDVRAPHGLIGPNAILQMLPVIEARGGPRLRDELLAVAGLGTLPDGTRMIDEAEAGRLHRALRDRLPAEAPDLAAEAGERTADYILAHRIPGPAKRLIRALPAPLGARLLAGAITRHAWTFAGSGTFRRLGPFAFEITDNPVIRGETSDVPLCHWHAAVFTRLYRVLVRRDLTCTETTCAATGAPHCRFELRRDRRPLMPVS